MSKRGLGYAVSVGNYFLSTSAAVGSFCFYHPECAAVGSIKIFRSRTKALVYVKKYVTKRNFKIQKVSIVDGKITFNTIYERGPA
jgi:hypothetical protein